MELEKFISESIDQIVTAVEKSSKKSKRLIFLDNQENQRSIEFDIAVTAEDSGGAGGQIKVLNLLSVGGGKEVRNTTVTRIKFGINVDKTTKASQKEKTRADVEKALENIRKKVSK